MKKNHLFISISTFLIVLLCAGFISCGGDDENDGTGNGDVPKEIAGIVGQWYSETIKNTTYAGKFSNIRVITLNADRTGTWTWAQYNYDKKTLKYIERYSGRYYYIESSGHLNFPDSEYGEFTILEVNENSIKYKFVTDEETFTRGVFDWSKVNGGTVVDDGDDDDDDDDDDDYNSTEPKWGKVTGTLKAYGTEYSSVAKQANGRSTTVDYVYYPTTGKYYVYGGAWDSSPSSNGGKGLRYDAKKGYNSIKINSGAYYDSSTKMKYNWEVYLQVTIP